MEVIFALAIMGAPLTPLVNQCVTGHAWLMYKILVLAVLAVPAWAGWVEDYRSGLGSRSATM
jgi:hypothetical protein